MKTDFKAIQAIAVDTEGAYHIGCVLGKAGVLFKSLDERDLMKLFTDLLFYVGNPESAQELKKDDFVCLTNGALSLAMMLADIRGHHEDFVKHAKKLGNE